MVSGLALMCERWVTSGPPSPIQAGDRQVAAGRVGTGRGRQEPGGCRANHSMLLQLLFAMMRGNGPMVLGPFSPGTVSTEESPRRKTQLEKLEGGVAIRRDDKGSGWHWIMRHNRT